MPTATISLHQAQKAFRESDALYRGFVGGRGVGKSFIGAYDLLRRAKPNRLYGAYAPTYPMLKDASFRTFMALGAQLRFIRAVNHSDLRVTLGNGAEVIFRSLDDPERARGPNLSGGWVDEASLVVREAYSIVIACLREAGEAGWLSATFTPKGKQHWTYEVFGLGAPNTALFHAKTTDNPFLPPEFYQAVRSQYTAQYAAQELSGEFVDLAGALFKREWFKVVERAPEDLRWVRFWDLATSVKTSADYTSSARCAFADDGMLYITDVIRNRWEWPDARKVITQAAINEIGTALGIETVAYQLAAVQELRRERVLANVALYEVGVDKDKLSRALPWASRAEAGKVALVRGGWIADFLDEACSFPGGEHDDQVDAVSGAVQMLAQSGPILFGAA